MPIKTLCKLMLFIGLLLLFYIVACTPAATPVPTSTPQIIIVYASPSTQPWLPEIYTCAAQTSAIIRYSASQSAAPSAAQIRLTLGEPANLTTPAYQIGSEDILIVAHNESPIQTLSAEEARALFSQGQAGIQLWVFPSGEDVQQVFEREIMRGGKINSFARLAASPQQMSDALNAESDALGILPRRWKTGTVHEVFSLPDVPVLAITPSEPQGALKELIACLQQKTAP